LTPQFYRGLKDEVKDDIVRGERPEELLPMIKKAINIDSRLYKRRLERKGQYTMGHHKKGNRHPTDRWSDRMELDATGKTGKLHCSKEEMDRRRDRDYATSVAYPDTKHLLTEKEMPRNKARRRAKLGPNS
jgi:hypothetical protein